MHFWSFKLSRKNSAGCVSNVNKHFPSGQPVAKFDKNQDLEMKVLLIHFWNFCKKTFYQLLSLLCTLQDIFDQKINNRKFDSYFGWMHWSFWNPWSWSAFNIIFKSASQYLGKSLHTYTLRHSYLTQEWNSKISYSFLYFNRHFTFGSGFLQFLAGT